MYLVVSTKSGIVFMLYTPLFCIVDIGEGYAESFFCNKNVERDRTRDTRYLRNMKYFIVNSFPCLGFKVLISSLLLTMFSCWFSSSWVFTLQIHKDILHGSNHQLFHLNCIWIMIVISMFEYSLPRFFWAFQVILAHKECSGRCSY